MDRYPEKQAVYSVDKPFRQTSLDLRHNATNWHPTRDFTRCVTAAGGTFNHFQAWDMLRWRLAQHVQHIDCSGSIGIINLFDWPYSSVSSKFDSHLRQTFA